MGKSRAAKIKRSGSDTELTIQQHETDSPLIPVEQLERLYSFRPDLVDWIIKETQTESSHRRSESHRVNTFIFIERILGQFFALIIGGGAILAGAYVATHGAQLAGAIIIGSAMTGLAVVFIAQRKGRSKKE